MPMRTRVFLKRGELLLALFFLLSPHVRAKEPAAQDLFRDAVVPSLHLQLSSEAVSSLSRSPRKYIKANVREGTKLYTNVAVRLKGGPGSFRQINDKPAFTVNFDKFAEGQTFHGLKKIHLNNSVQDRTYLHEKLSRELFEAAGVPVPRAGNAWVNFNDREMGMYVLLEGVNKQFLKRYFKDVSGNVYDGHSGTEVTMKMHINSGDHRDWDRLEDLAQAAREPDLEARYAALQKTLDLERFYSFVAVELILGHWDGYTMNRNNWRIYHDKDSNRMVFIPHGLDQVLGRNYGLYPQTSQALVVRSVLEIPEARKRYRERYAEIVTNVFIASTFSSRVQDVGAKIEAVIAKHDAQEAETHKQFVTAICRRIVTRSNSLQNLFTPATPVKFDQAGGGLLTKWVSKPDKGEPQFNREEDSDGKPLLHIAARNGLCIGSWRTICELEPGTYSFQARIKTKGVVFPGGEQAQRAGAGLRISGYRTGQKNSGDRDWTPISFQFHVSEEQSEIELVCELFAKEGEIWYDLSSLKLVRKE